MIHMVKILFNQMSKVIPYLNVLSSDQRRLELPVDAQPKEVRFL